MPTALPARWKVWPSKPRACRISVVAKEADAIYQELLAKLDKLYDDRSRWDVVLAAARNASNLGDLADAAARYKELSKYGMLSDAAKLEYAGVLYRIGQADEAAHLLEQGSPNVQDLRLLASIYSCGKHFSKAIAIYEQLLKILPDDALAPRGLADNLSWSHEFGQAATVYRELLHQCAKDDELRERLAETLLFDKQYQDSLRQYAKLLARHPKSQDFRNGFLMAAAGSPSLGEADRGRLERIYKQHGRHENVAYLTSLLNAVSKHGTPEQAVPLLQSLLERAPITPSCGFDWPTRCTIWVGSRTRTLNIVWLLGDSPPHAAGKSPAILPVEARR